MNNERIIEIKTNIEKLIGYELEIKKIDPLTILSDPDQNKSAMIIFNNYNYNDTSDSKDNSITFKFFDFVKTYENSDEFLLNFSSKGDSLIDYFTTNIKRITPYINIRETDIYEGNQIEFIPYLYFELENNDKFSIEYKNKNIVNSDKYQNKKISYIIDNILNDDIMKSKYIQYDGDKDKFIKSLEFHYVQFYTNVKTCENRILNIYNNKISDCPLSIDDVILFFNENFDRYEIKNMILK